VGHCGGSLLTVMFASSVELPMVAVIRAVPAATAVTWKPADDVPPAMTTDAGTVATFGFDDVRLTVVSP
jgi:hypothetical protein